jgi:ribosomal protein S18 acetylase RimI-like enzyme
VPGWTIRSATREDIGAVLVLWREAAAHATVGADRAGLERLLASDAEALLLAEAPTTNAGAPGAASARGAAGDDRLLGSLIAVWDGWRGSFYRLTVHPRHRREGLGTALVREGERRLGARKAPRSTAIVADEDAGAREFWAAAGYTHQPDRERFVRELAP